MPINKILITHKFGIISQSHKRQLQERLIKQRLLLESQNRRKQKSNEDQINLQINEEFVKEYNEGSIDRKTKLNHQCFQIYEKLKKKLSNPNKIDDLTIQLCWAELSQLMQCSSPLQEDCMDLFIMSLEYAKLSSSQIPTLFFLAETIIYWIRTDTINQPFLRAFEIKLLKVGKLIFERIYIHLIDKSLEDQDDLKEHLSIYLQGFSDLATAYSPYPDAFLYIEFMIKIGEILLSSNRHTVSASSATPSTYYTESERRLSLSNRFLWTAVELHKLLNSKYTPEKLENCLNRLSSLSFEENNWLDSSLSFYILAESSKINIKALKLFLNLSKSEDDYDDKSIYNEISPGKGLKSFGLEKWPIELACVYVELLTDICINAISASIKSKILLGEHKEANDAFKNNDCSIYGLLDVAKYNLNGEKDWMIRYMGIKGLVKICKILNDKENEELRQTAWACLVILQETEKNANVLEALKVGQINSKVEPVKNKKIITDERKNQQNVYSQIAFRLGELKEYGSPKSQAKNAESSADDYKSLRLDSVPFESVVSQNKSVLTNETKIVNDSFIEKKKRTTLREEIILSNQFESKIPNYYERKNVDLMRIVEDQYRKDLRDNFKDS